MGSGSSTQQSIVNETLNSAVTNVVTSKKQSNSVAISNTNNTTVIFGPRSETIGCGINASQSIKSKNSISKMETFVSEQDLQTALKSALNSKIDNSNKTEQGAFATALNVTSDKSNIKNEVKNLVENNITSDTVSEFNNTVDNLNKGVFEFNGKISIIYPDEEELEDAMTFVNKNYGNDFSKQNVNITKELQNVAAPIRR
jgi:hypothetical protein